MGRPREFDEDKVLAAAGDVFWALGFEATSTRALTECTGLTPASIYNAFGDKRGFFLRALRYYLDQTLRERIVRLESTQSPGRAIAGFFREIISRSLADPEHRGCMLMNTAMEVTTGDPEMQRIVADETAIIERFFYRCAVAGQKTGEIPKGQPAEDIARMLLGLLAGLRLLARIRPDAKLLNGMVRPALAALNLVLPRK
ncbi:TetR/AcrR family transcriptional regulator [Bradyrhizobium sp. G127]|jgi:TetR/AcrR family transcriptional repressor of nem operon|uniref:TetR/AcrR family transcriptional regulator n=1 Tax=Bradyrhizobium sp. G127 TaxID=2904800 RepID=UPI001F404CEF|nr:TetR/AcrR family transcriptional regulator [Bradyrhizobium sp. G127]MCF2521828.1 TetR/AcrR family transcriptional regulator [Bradyrhizobium sp. G127]